MTAVAPRVDRPVAPERPLPHGTGRRGNIFWELLTTTDHKMLGIMYIVMCYVWYVIGGIMALLIRAELFHPGMQFLSNEQYNQLFTMHGTIMLLAYGTPIVWGFANYIVPLQIGAPDVAFPRLNAFGFWITQVGIVAFCAGFVTPGGAGDFGWTIYAPLSDAIHSPGVGTDFWIVGVGATGVGTLASAINMVTTILCLRAPGMTMFRMPIFVWNIFVASVIALLIFPVLTAAALGVLYDRKLGGHIFSAGNGGALLWQHLFWFFGHPEVYVLALPFFGIVSEIVPVFSRKPMFGYVGLIFATLSIGGLSMAVWAHHLYPTGAVLLPFFSFMTFLIAVPTGMKFFNWVGTMWKGHITMETPMLWTVGFLATFLFGGMTGIMLASPPLDFHIADSYFLVAHFHYTLFGTIFLSATAGVYFWFPKMTGRMLDETLGKIHFWLTFIGFHATFMVQHWLGNMGMARRYADYLDTDGFTLLNQVSTVGSLILGISVLPFFWNVFKSWRYGEVVTVDDPWGYGNSLEWATSCPPPSHNFTSLPRIRSERPAFELHYPHLVEQARAEMHVGRH
ncbi:MULTISPECIES: cytochrome c oxidase subunit I [Corynebacterium]|uniref:aa3-type cytochrome oxidase subunit I n=1 Tax=Corynebacterium TaxID=1716 RepID=UPI00019C1EC0|nr:MULTISPECIES: cytochrome c oxidase subunit I [Corynebacterium]EEI27091.1 cytochrome c oxidase, subunit 1 [Corynebacterium glucuronolyticum ATCC 51867]MCT1563726.1 cytochrome c oxidase subunit I [Corynebacterium glucuronolyticum]OFO49675.1 cytochrome ubiquinol oxidase subunit I [Corynebacterium sp. HMSC073D01]QQU88993.1 cytochrome ubiquinol oxidase subunit I [Corynebacterium glucuronolyticum]QRO82658.1 cytochrome ubiquinol oxidase subunit I [Corynebacterium glucuronolyticum]